jgi:hypothetical protein
MDFAFDITALGMAVLVIGALVYGVALNLYGEYNPLAYGWVLTSVATFLGAFIASEYVGLDTFAPTWEGLALWPALVGGLVAGGVVEVIIRLVHHRPRVPGAHPA